MSPRPTAGRRASGAGPITRAEIERKLDEINASVDAGAETVEGVGKAAGAATFVGAVATAYLLGRRRGRRRRTIVEVRRI